MTYQVSVSGHAASKEDEAKVLDVVRTAVENLQGTSEVYTATASTQYHGVEDLKTKSE